MKVRPYLNQASPAGEQDTNVETHFFGLFDGHAGGRCSNYVAGSLPNVLAEDPSFFTNLPQALKRSFHTTNEQFLKVAEKMKYHDGSTGITAVVRDSKVLVANVGDCRALIISGGRPIQMSIDQKPTNPEEQKRITALGGTVVYCMGVARVNRVLAVSRAFGNRTLRSVIRPDAEMMQRELTKDDDYLVMASDGLWDVLKNKDVCDVCYSPFTQCNPQTIAEELVHAALQRGSMDNVTCIVVRLTDYVQRILGARAAAAGGGLAGAGAGGGIAGSAALQASMPSHMALERSSSLKNVAQTNTVSSALRQLDTTGLGIGNNNNNNNHSMSGNSSPSGGATMPSLSRQYSTGSIPPQQQQQQQPSSSFSSPAAVDNYLHSPNRPRVGSNGNGNGSVDPFHLPPTSSVGSNGRVSPNPTGIAHMKKSNSLFAHEEAGDSSSSAGQMQTPQWLAMQQQQQLQEPSGGGSSGYASRRPSTMGGSSASNILGGSRSSFSSAMPNLISMFGSSGGGGGGSSMPPISGGNNAHNSISRAPSGNGPSAFSTDLSGGSSDHSPAASSSGGGGVWNSEGDYSGSSFGSAYTESTLGRVNNHSYQQKPSSLTNMFPMGYKKPPSRK